MNKRHMSYGLRHLYASLLDLYTERQRFRDENPEKYIRLHNQNDGFLSQCAREIFDQLSDDERDLAMDFAEILSAVDGDIYL